MSPDTVPEPSSDAKPEGASPRRRGRRRSVGAETGSPPINQQQFFKPQNHMAPLTPLSDDHIAEIHNQSLRILSELGIEVDSANARAAYKDAGADVDEASHIVRLDEALVMQLVASAPASFTLTPTNPDRALTIGSNNIYFGLVSGAPNVHCALKGRRTGNFEDYKNLIKLGQYFNAIHFFGNQALAPNDLAVNTRHLDTVLVNLTLSDKIFLTMSIGEVRVSDAAQMLAIARGISLDELSQSPSCITNININSPRKFDTEMAAAAMYLARLGQAVVVTPFTLMGAMTPVTMAAALAQQNAEALMGICLTQIVNPGAPVVYGGFTSNVDLKTGAPAFGTPENTLANMAGGQLARHYDLPYRTSACSASNCVDAQGIWETQMALWGAVTGHGNLIYHAAGWQEGGLVASYEKLIVDIEMLQAMHRILAPLSFSEADFGFDAQRQTPAGGHFFGVDHTLERYKTAFYSPILSDWSNNEAWEKQGGLRADERATAIWQQALEDYKPPSMPADRVEALEAFVSKRKEEIGTSEI